MPVRLLFLDRDGTLNCTVGQRPPNHPDEVELLPGVEPLLSRYAADGWQLVVVTNQGGVASGYFTEAQAQAVQQRVLDVLPVSIAASYLCPHMPDAVVPEYAIDCPNRKPRPGFILAALQTFDARAEDCLLVGDSITDKQAAQAASVPYRWADRFFGRPMRRGLRSRDGQWVQLREAMARDAEAMLALIHLVAREEGTEALRRLKESLHGWLDADGQDMESRKRDLYLLAVKDSIAVGWLALLRGRRPGTAHAADLTFGVDAAHRGVGIGSLLVEMGLVWAGWQPGLGRICVEAPADNLPVSRLCCMLGFVKEGRRKRQKRTWLANTMTWLRGRAAADRLLLRGLDL